MKENQFGWVFDNKRWYKYVGVNRLNGTESMVFHVHETDGINIFDCGLMLVDGGMGLIVILRENESL